MAPQGPCRAHSPGGGGPPPGVTGVHPRADGRSVPRALSRSAREGRIADMCGIAGKYGLNGEPVDRALLARMAAVMIHRGPDDEGSYVSATGTFGMTMRRLSIIDLD